LSFFPLSIFFEFVILIGIGLVLLQHDGILPKILAGILFVSGIQIATAKQIWVVEATPGILSLATLSTYPTAYVVILVWLHLGLAYYALALILRIFGRNPIGKKYPKTTSV
jgi:multisubunit Na+/H+ antiporter MnhC subunit